MKRFLIALFICLMAFGVRAKEDTPLALQIAASLAGSVGDLISHPVSIVARNFDTVDPLLASYIDKNDYQVIQDNDSAFYYLSSKDLIIHTVKQDGQNYSAMYDPEHNRITIDPGLADQTITQILVHHEVQHMKDFTILNNAGYDIENIESDMDAFSYRMLHAIAEGRAYAETAAFTYGKMDALYKNMKNLEEASEKIKQSGEPVDFEYPYLQSSAAMERQYFESVVNEAWDLLDEDGSKSISAKNIDSLYKKIKEEYEKFKEVYDREIEFGDPEKYKEEGKELPMNENVLGNPTTKVFDEAIRAGKSIDEAKRLAALALLDSRFYSHNYAGGNTKGTLHLSLEEILNLLNGDENLGNNIFTLEDLYSVKNIWTACNMAPDEELCKPYFEQYEAEKCPNLREKWKTCARLKKVLEVEKKCDYCNRILEHSQRYCKEHEKEYRKIRWTTKEDENEAEACCSSNLAKGMNL